MENGTSQLNRPQLSDIMHDNRFDSQSEKIYLQSFQKTALLPTFSEFAVNSWYLLVFLHLLMNDQT